MSANCYYSKKFLPLAKLKWDEVSKNEDAYKAWLQETFLDKTDALYNQIISSLGPNPERTNNIGSKQLEGPMIQGRMILDATNNTSYKDAFVGRADLLMSLEQKFKSDIVSRSVYSREANEFIEADKVDDQSGLTVLNKNIVDYKQSLINSLYTIMGKENTPKLDYKMSANEYTATINQALAEYRSWRDQHKGTLKGLQEYTILSKFDEMLGRLTEFVAPKNATLIDSPNRYEYKGPTVQHYTSFGDKNASIESQTSNLVKILLSVLPEVELDSQGREQIVEGSFIGLSGFNSSMMALKQELLFGHKLSPELAEQYFSGNNINLGDIVTEYLKKQTGRKESYNAAYFDMRQTYLLGKLRGLNKFIFNNKKLAESPMGQLLLSDMKSMFFKTEAVSYRGYTVDNDSGRFSGRNLRSNFISTQKARLADAIRGAVNFLKTDVEEQARLTETYNINITPRSISFSRDNETLTVTFTKRKGGHNLVVSGNASPKFVSDMVNDIMMYIIPDTYYRVGQQMEANNFNYVADWGRLLAITTLAAFKDGIIDKGKGGLIDLRGYNDYLLRASKKLSVIFGAENVNVINNPNGDKVPLFQLTNLTYNTKSLLYHLKNAPNAINKDSIFLLYPELLTAPQVRSQVKIGDNVKDPSKLSEKELLHLSVLEDFYAPLLENLDVEAADTIVYMQNATFADKPTHYLIGYNLSTKVTLASGEKASLKSLLKDILTTGDSSKLQEFTRQTRRVRINNLARTIIDDYKKVFLTDGLIRSDVDSSEINALRSDFNFNTLEDVDFFLQHAKYKGKPLTIKALTQLFVGRGVQFDEEIHAYKPKNGKLGDARVNETILNYQKTYNSKELFDARMKQAKTRFVENLMKNRVSWNRYDSTTLNDIAQRHPHWVNPVSGDIVLIHNGKLHPVLEAYFAADALLSNEYNAVTIGEVYAHPNKNKRLTSQQQTVNFDEFQLFSGGASGSDTEWANRAKVLGISTKHYTTADYDNLSSTEKAEIERQYTEVLSVIGRRPLDANSYSGKLVRRSMMQANSADSIFAINSIDSLGRVNGGTAYAVTRGIILKKPVYVFDQFQNKWFTVDYNTNRWTPVQNSNNLKLTKNAAVIGAREINANGIAAIDNIIENTRNSTSNISGEETGTYEEFSEANRLIAQIKRSVAFGATWHPYTQNLLNGVAPSINIAVFSDLPGSVYTPNGTSDELQGVGHTVDSMDGSGWSHPLQARLENNSLLSAGVQENKKSIMMDIDYRTGKPILLKWAVYSLSNDVRRIGYNSTVNAENLYRRMNNKYIGKHLDMNALLMERNKPIYYYNPETDSYYKIKDIRTIEGRENGISVTYADKFIVKINPENGEELADTAHWTSETADDQYAPIRTLYDVDRFFGGCWSADWNAEAKTFEWTETNLDVLESLVSKQENQDLKDKFIAYAVNKSAIKVGAGNVNSSDSWKDDSTLATIQMSTRYGGIQMDFDHDLDHADVTEGTQMISALIENCHYPEIVNDIYSDIGQIVAKHIEKLQIPITALDSPETTPGEKLAAREVLYRELGKALYRAFKENNRDTRGLAQSFLELAKQSLDNQDNTYKIPFSAATINGIFISDVISDINRGGIRHKYSGFAGVLNPSYGIIETYRIFNPETGEFENRVFKDLIGFARKLGIQKISDLKAAFINGVLNPLMRPLDLTRDNIEFEDTVVVLRPDGVYEEPLLIDNFTIRDNLMMRLRNNPGLQVFVHQGYGRNLRGVETYFNVGNKTYSIYDLDSVRASQYITALIDGENITPEQERLVNRVLGEGWKVDLVSAWKRAQEITQNTLHNLEDTGMIGISEAFQMDNLLNEGTTAIPATNIWTRPAEIVSGRYHANNFGLNQKDQIYNIKDAKFFRDKMTDVFTEPTTVPGQLYDIVLFEGDKQWLVKIGDEDTIAKAVAGINGLSDNPDITYNYDDVVYDDNILVNKTGFKFKTYVNENGEKFNVVFADNVDRYRQLLKSGIFNRKVQVLNINENNFSTLKEVRFGKSDKITYNISDTERRTVDAGLLTMRIFQDSEIYRLNYQKQKHAEDMYESFKKQLYYVGARIPTQAMQSFMPMEVIAFADNTKNVIYVPRANTFLEGSIKKL